MTGRYAESTDVTSEKSRLEIERTLRRYGARAFAYAYDDNQAQVAFEMAERRIVLRVTLPGRDEFTVTQAGRSRRSGTAIDTAWEQGCRQRWRALALVIKAKLEAVEAGISTIEEEFLAHLQLPGGATVGDQLIPQLGEALAGRELPALIQGGRRG